MTLLSYKNMVKGQGSIRVKKRIVKLSYSLQKGKIYLHVIKKMNLYYC